MTNITKNITDAIDRSRSDLESGRAAWAPVFVDLMVDNKKIAHIVSDGHVHETWSFYPIDDGRMQRLNKTFADVIPVWASKAEFAPAKTYRETMRKIDALADTMAAVVWTYKGEDITRQQLSDAFDLVKDPEAWKNPIDKVIELEMNSRAWAILDYAITFFAGCGAEYYDEGPGKLRVVAAGYYMSVGS